MSARISIVLCTYNGEKYLALQLDSILSQTYPIYEIIIQDDCSSDGTKDIINDYVHNHPVIKPYFNEKNLGFKRNFSDAVSKASGDYIALADQDDIWLPNHVETLVNIIGDKPMACADSIFIDSFGKELGLTISQEKQMSHFYNDEIDYAYRLFYYSGFFHGHNMLLKNTFVKEALPIPDDIAFHDVWFSALACFKGGINYSNKTISLYRKHQNTVTSHKKFNIFREVIMRHHYDFPTDRIALYKHIVTRNDISQKGIVFLSEFRQYFTRCPFLKYRFWCWKWRFSHYKLIYTTNSFKYIFLRSIQYILTPSVTKKEDVFGFIEKDN